MARNEILDPVEAAEMAQAFAQSASGQEIAPLGERRDMIEITDGVITAQKVAVPRDDAKVLRRLAALAAAAGGDWFYRFPVKKKGGGVDSIEGPSIKCANSVVRCYGNCQVDCRVVDAGSTWLIYSRFVDYETGFSMTRPFQQDKGGAKIGGDDLARKRDIALQIGISKSIRNVVCNALSDFTDFAFEEAKKNLVGRVGKNLGTYKDRLKDRFAEIDVDLARVEAIHGRKWVDWLAPLVSLIIAELQAVNDGMATVDETWPPLGVAEPKRSDAPPETTSGPLPEGTVPQASENPGVRAAREDFEQSNKSMVQDGTKGAPPADDFPVKNWRIADTIIGQDNIEKAILDCVGMAASRGELDDIEQQNGDKLAKFSTVRRSKITKAIEDKGLAIDQGKAS